MPRVVGLREIGIAGTVARVVVGAIFLTSVISGQLHTFHPVSWIVGLVVFPGLTVGWQRIRLHYTRDRLRATGPVPHLVNIAVFVALCLTPLYAPALAFTSDAALLFYGTSMLLAAARGYAGCEVLAISNWLLGRNDQVGCLVFGPIDAIDARRHPNRTPPDNTVARPGPPSATAHHPR
jgi:hypothetical protein